MADCLCSGLVASCKNWVSNGKSGCNLSVSCASGELYRFFSRKQLPDFAFGTPVVVHFDVGFFNDKPNSLNAVEVKLMEDKK